MEDVLKRIEALEKEYKELKLEKKSNLNAFGRTYSLIGNSTSDLLLKTKGLVKIQYGNIFIDLIKDGKINVDSKFIFKGKVGNKDGIYLTDDGSVYLKIGDNTINLVGEVGTTYVSFLEEQLTSADEKYVALKNIGFIYSDLNSIDSSSLLNGIIYIESELKLYIVRNGALTEFTIQFPNPFTELFIIQKNDFNLGALYIKGSGIYNSLAFDSFYIFTENGNTYLLSNGEVNISIDDLTILNITKERTIIKNIVESNTFQSIGADYVSGFKLINENGKSTLYIDRIIVRDSEDSDVETNMIYPTTWSLKNNIITKAGEVHHETFGDGYALSLLYENTYLANDYLYVYGYIKNENDSFRIIKIPMLVKDSNTDTENNIYVSILTELLEEDISEIPSLIGHTTFLVGSEEKVNLIRYSEHNIDLIESLSIENEESIVSIKNRYGILDELELKEKDNKAGTELGIEGIGIYSELGYFDKAGYTTDYLLEEDDDSTKFASTEWVLKLLKEPLKAINDADLGEPTSSENPIVIAFDRAWTYLAIPNNLINRLTTLETSISNLTTTVSNLTTSVGSLTSRVQALEDTIP